MRAASLFAAFVTGTIFASFLALAWTGPTSAPPAGNVAAPLNIGTTDQIKDAGLGLNALAVFGNSILSGSSVTYLNFGTLPEADGYGIRDNAGTMEFKNSGGNWNSFLPASGVQSIAFADGTTQTTAGGSGMQISAILEDRRPSGTEGGGSVASTWSTRTLNTEAYDPENIVTLSSNLFTLVPGTYYLNWHAQFGYEVGNVHSRIYSVSDGGTAIVGTSDHSSGWAAVQSTGSGVITTAAPKTFRLEYFTQSGRATVGLGRNASSGEENVYARIEIWK